MHEKRMLNIDGVGGMVSGILQRRAAKIGSEATSPVC